VGDLFKILAIDGGGIRGIIPALVLAEIESRTGRSVQSLFDLIAGTSTGGILALGLTCPDKSGGPKFSAVDLANLYINSGSKIFAKRRFSRLRSFFSSKYQPDALKKILFHYFGQTMISQSLTDILITCYSLNRRGIKNLSSRDAKNNNFDDISMVSAALATSAAPTYFPPAQIEGFHFDHYQSFVDGGIFANNPSALALAEASRRGISLDRVLLVSIGTGKSGHEIFPIEKKGWGLLQWIQKDPWAVHPPDTPPILEVIFDASSELADIVSSNLLSSTGQPQRYYRIQEILPVNRVSMDDTSAEYMAYLQNHANTTIRVSSRNIGQICRQL